MNNSGLIEDNNNDNVFEKKFSFNKTDILSLIEKAYSDRDKALASYSNLKMDYNELQKEYNILQSKIKSLENNLKTANAKSSYSEQKLNEKMYYLIQIVF